MAGLIIVDGLTKSFVEGGSTRHVLKGLDLKVDAGEMLAVGGPSGSGKSTLLNIMGGIDTPDDGAVTMGDVRIDRLSETRRTLHRRRNIGMVFQFFNLVPTLTVGENLRLPLALCGMRDRRDDVQQWLDRLGMSHRADAYPDNLSGGEQQRVAIIRAAIHRPSLVLADEPTGNLDQQMGNEVIRLLRDLSDGGISVVMATHSRSAAGVADRRLVLKEGRLEPWAW